MGYNRLSRSVLFPVGIWESCSPHKDTGHDDAYFPVEFFSDSENFRRTWPEPLWILPTTQRLLYLSTLLEIFRAWGILAGAIC